MGDISQKPYILRGTQGEALYVGISEAPEKRLPDHRRKVWGGEIAGLEIVAPIPGESALDAERRLIREVAPLYNRNEGGVGPHPAETRKQRAAYLLRAEEADMARWQADAAGAGKTLAEWIRESLDARSAKKA